MNELFLARQDDDALANLVIPGELVTLPGYQLNDLQSMMQQSQLALAAFQAGLAVAVNLNLGGFDTHANHDTDQVLQIAKLLAGVDFLIDEATKIGIDGQLIIVIASDFARGPGYNGLDPYSGKDHWPVTSAMLMGPGIPGNRVIGGTDATQLAIPTTAPPSPRTTCTTPYAASPASPPTRSPSVTPSLAPTSACSPEP